MTCLCCVDEAIRLEGHNTLCRQMVLNLGVKFANQVGSSDHETEFNGKRINSMTNSTSTADPYIYIVMLPQTTGCFETGRSTPQKFSEERFNCTRATTLMQSRPAHARTWHQRRTRCCRNPGQSVSSLSMHCRPINDLQLYITHLVKMLPRLGHIIHPGHGCKIEFPLSSTPNILPPSYTQGKLVV